MKMYRSRAAPSSYVIHAGDCVIVCDAGIVRANGDGRAAFIGKPGTVVLDILHDPARYTEVSLPDNADTLLLTLLQEFCKHVANSDR